MRRRTALAVGVTAALAALALTRVGVVGLGARDAGARAAWAPDVAPFGDHFMLYFTSQLAGVSPPTMCIGDAISTAVVGP